MGVDRKENYDHVQPKPVQRVSIDTTGARPFAGTGWGNDDNTHGDNAKDKLAGLISQFE